VDEESHEIDGASDDRKVGWEGYFRRMGEIYGKNLEEEIICVIFAENSKNSFY